MKKLAIKNLVIYFFLIVMIGSCQKKDNALQSNTFFDIDSKELEKENSVCDLIFYGTYLEWWQNRIPNGYCAYFPLTSLDTILNKNRKFYENRYLTIKKNWLMLIEVGNPHEYINEYPLIPLTYAADKETLKEFLTTIGWPIPTNLGSIEINHTQIEDDHYRVTIFIQRPLGRSHMQGYHTCEHTIDFYCKKGIYNFSNTCDDIFIW